MHLHRINQLCFPQRQGNTFKLLVDGEQYFAAIVNEIDAAHSFIYIEQYLIASGHVCKQLIAALARAKARGVRVYCLFDDYGSRALSQYDRQQMINVGIHLRFYNPLHRRHWRQALFRDHRKILVMDGHTGIVGGAGFTDDFSPEGSPEHYWHDVMLKVQGPVVADWQKLFEINWQHSSKQHIHATAAVASTGQQTGQVITNQPFHQEITRSVLRNIQTARQRVWITTPYFVPTWKMRRRLRRKSREGIDVRLLLAGDRSDHLWVTQAGRRYYSRLLRHGVRIYEYQPRFNHAKVVLCDEWSSIGSSNLDRWDQHWNQDANQAVMDAVFAEEVKSLFEKNFALSHEIQLAQWLQRSWWQRFREWYAGYVVLILEHLSRYFPQRRD